MKPKDRPPSPQAARRARAAPLGADALGHTDAALKRAGFPDPALVLRWADIAGEEVAAVARPIRCRQGPEGLVLTLSCDPGAAVFLQHQTRTLLGRVNAFLGPARVLRLKLTQAAPGAETEIPPHPGRFLPARTEDDAPSLAASLARLARLRASLPRKPRG
jgi:hypothetical protein